MLDLRLHDEEARLAAVYRLNALDTPAEEQFEKIIDLVRTVLGVPMATVTLIEVERQWFKAQRGMPTPETPRAISFCTHTIQQRAPLVVPDARADLRFANSPLVTGAPHIRAYAGIPLCTPDGYNVGALCAIDSKPRSFNEAEIAIMTNLSGIVMEQLELRLIARRDHLTGALTRRGFTEELGKQLARHAGGGPASALALLDVDNFKAINDAHGHPAGDRVLQQLALVGEAVMRPGDHFGRIGGEEFGLLVADSTGAEALGAAERFRAAIAAHRFDTGDGAALAVTASFGVAPVGCGPASAQAWLAAADEALYRAKRGGRNRVCAAQGEVVREAALGA